jgi:MFS family permease
LKDPLFIIFTCSTFTTFLGYIVPYFYIATYAQDALRTSESTALYILVACLAGSFFGRLLWGYVAQRGGNMVTWIGCAIASGVLGLSWIGIDHEANFIAFSVLWGTPAPLSPIPSPRLAYTNVNPPRLLLREPRHTPRLLLPEYLPRPLAPRHTSRHVMGNVVDCVADRCADCWCPAKDENGG